MSMFFITLEVSPTKHNSQVDLVEGAIAHCWVVEETEVAAYNTASFQVSRDEWDITGSTQGFDVFGLLWSPRFYSLQAN